MDLDKLSFGEQDPSFIPTWLAPNPTMRMPILIRNTADHYNFPPKKTKRKQINKMGKYTLILRLVTQSNVNRTPTSCKLHNVSSNFNLWQNVQTVSNIIFETMFITLPYPR